MNIETNGIEIGDKVHDTITKFEGIVIAITQWTTGCARAVVQAPIDKDGKIPEGQTIDVLQLIVVKAGPRHANPTPHQGGPRPSAVARPATVR